jgi:hypothetical protein
MIIYTNSSFWAGTYAFYPVCNYPVLNPNPITLLGSSGVYVMARNFTFNRGSHFAQLVIPMRGNQIATTTFSRKRRVTLTSKFNMATDSNIFIDYDIT